MTTATATQTGWFLRKRTGNHLGRDEITGALRTYDYYVAIYKYGDGEERSFYAEYEFSRDECVRRRNLEFNDGKTAPPRRAKPTAAEMDDLLWRACLSDAF